MYVEPTLHPGDKFNLIVMDKFFSVLLDLVSQDFIEDFCTYVHQGYWLEVFFLFLRGAGEWWPGNSLALFAQAVVQWHDLGSL